MGDNERLWTSTEVLQVLRGLMHAYYATPWPFRFLMRPWRDALIAAGIAIAGREADEALTYDQMKRSLLEDFE